ncbi:MAG TPA: alpha/beta hydrolase [Symbiobacteriaceae bacterium]|nr:alpha/beta hydrolase [Symbiobacteriaceae bacterium]
MEPTGIRHREINTPRLRVHVRESGKGPVPVIFVHGNCSTGIFFEELMAKLPEQFTAIAPDLRGYGETEALPIDATRGCGEWADDLDALVETLHLERFHLAGWSLGAGVCMQYALGHPDRLLSLTLIDPLSPFGFGGTKDAEGTPTAPDFAGSGGGTVNADFVNRIKEQDAGAEPNSPRTVMKSFYVKQPFVVAPDLEDRWVESLLSTRTGPDFYPGDAVPSANWPMVAPGTRGVANAMSAKYHNVSAFAGIQPQPPVLWVRGADDQIVSDTSFFDLAFLGSLGYVPGWPGAEACPPQPMVSQMRTVLEKYRAAGGQYAEVVIADAGHSPFLEKPEEFRAAFLKLITA